MASKETSSISDGFIHLTKMLGLIFATILLVENIKIQPYGNLLKIRYMYRKRRHGYLVACT
jgi:hypothetical protein